MIQIYPTTDSGLSFADYSLKLPTSIEPLQEAPQKVSRTLSGGAVVSRWAKNNAGAVEATTITIDLDKYETLKSIANHPTVFEWVVISKGVKYLATIDITASEAVFRNMQPARTLTVRFTIVEENYST